MLKYTESIEIYAQNIGFFQQRYIHCAVRYYTLVLYPCTLVSSTLALSRETRAASRCRTTVYHSISAPACIFALNTCNCTLGQTSRQIHALSVIPAATVLVLATKTYTSSHRLYGTPAANADYYRSAPPKLIPLVIDRMELQLPILCRRQVSQNSRHFYAAANSAGTFTFIQAGSSSSRSLQSGRNSPPDTHAETLLASP